MKNWIKENTGVITGLVLLASFIIALAPEPGAAIQGSGGWLIVRGITLVWAVFIGIASYTKWTFKIRQSKSKDLAMWFLWWVISTQVMASYYISEWCKGGF